MSEPNELDREFAVFSAYLGASGAGGNEHVRNRYRSAHATLPADADRLDRWLVSVARAGTMATSLADAYARRARPYGLLRRKLVLTLALLESGRVTHARFDEARPARMHTTLFALGAAGIWWLVRTVIAVVVFAPLHLAAFVAPGGCDG